MATITIGPEFRTLKLLVKDMVECRHIGLSITNELADTLEVMEQLRTDLLDTPNHQREGVLQDINVCESVARDHMRDGLRAALKLLDYQTEIESVTPGLPFRVECRGHSTVQDVAYVKEHLQRDDIQLLVYLDDWSAVDLRTIREAAISSGVELVTERHRPQP